MLLLKLSNGYKGSVCGHRVESDVANFGVGLNFPILARKTQPYRGRCVTHICRHSTRASIPLPDRFIERDDDEVAC